MKKNTLIIVIAALLLSSCSAYKASQTPDDVYYSPVRNTGEKETSYYSNNSTDDWYLTMKSRNYTLWSSLDDYSYWYDSRYSFNNYNYNYYYNTSGLTYHPSFNNYYGWNYYYSNGLTNPVCGVISYKTPRYYGSTSGSNVSAYKNRTYNNGNTPSNSPFSFSKPTPQSSSTNNSSYNTPARTITTTPSSSAGGSSGGYNSSGSSASSGRTGRGG